ncbi:MAG: asparagine synthase C-terminal domain-containing protein [Bacilli bacterium]|nr:asparagine synthase C-terminal domain-containing protein [Bacilli bacterium]
MNVDKKYCMSSFLMFRTIVDDEKQFTEKIVPQKIDINFNRVPISSSDELYLSLKNKVEQACKDGKAALALSGGIDSAILAKFMPKGSTVYTFKCIVPGINVTDETEMAAKYAQECGLKQKIVEIYWDDIVNYAPILMKHKGAPIHSIEIQIYKASLQAKKDGFERLIFGENADIIYGGMDGLLSKDWLIGEFIDRYSYVLPYKVLKNFELISEPFKKYTIDGKCDSYGFINEYFRKESLGSYCNACETAGIEFIGPFSETYLSIPINYEKIRNGESKYLVREVFRKLYKNTEIPVKTPMPRPTNEWFKNWKGPEREEFYKHCTDNMSGDQKWLVYILEQFLNLIEE